VQYHWEYIMVIGKAEESDWWVYIYDDKGSETGSVPMGSYGLLSDGLKGYTSTTVNLQVGLLTYAYNEKGILISSTPA
jgi:hypothetical protein